MTCVVLMKSSRFLINVAILQSNLAANTILFGIVAKISNDLGFTFELLKSVS